jgi:AcrR family transcriptional regulator
MPAIPPSTKEQIVLAGERLFAQHGIDGISLRQIGTAAGAGNNSAVQYHFGTKEQLAQAIFEYRLPGLQQRRALLIATTGDSSLRDLLSCQVLPVMEQAEQPGSHYLAFLAMLAQYRRIDVIKRLEPESLQPAQALSEQVSARLPHLPPGLARHRFSRAMSLLIQAAADREQANADGRPVLAFRLDVADLLDCMAGILQAPASPDAVAAIKAGHGIGLPQALFP